MRPRPGMSLTFDVKDVVGAMNAIAKRLRDPERPMRRLGAHMTRRIKKSMPSGGGEASKPGAFPNTQRGARGLRGTITYNVLLNAFSTKLEVGSPAIYADVIDRGTEEALGGPIRPKHGKALAIPIDDAAQNRRPRDFHDLVFLKRKNKPPLLGQTRGEDFHPLFVLLTSVTIKARPFLEFLPSDEEFGLQVFTEELLEEPPEEGK